MQIETKELEESVFLVNYTADAEQILEKRAEVLKLFKKAPVKGFREGKAPIDAIQMYYRTQIDEAVKRGLAEDSYHNTIFEKKLRPHGTPQFKSLRLEGGKFHCEFEIRTKPDFEVAPFKNLEVPKPPDTISTEEMAEQMLQELRVKFGDVVPFSETDFVQNGDNLLLDYEGSIDGKIEEGLSAKGEMFVQGKNQIVGFDENLLGMNSGDTREFDVVVPENSLPSISGKTVHFKVTLTTGAKSVPCPLNDELAKHMGKNTFAELRELVVATAASRVQNNQRAAVNQAIANRLVADNNISVPNWMSLSEAQYLAQQSKLDWKVMSDQDKEQFLDIATKNVKLSLVLDKIREDEPEAQLSDQEVFEIIRQNVNQSGQKFDDVVKEMQKNGYLQILFARIRDEHCMDFISKTTKLIE